MRDLFAPAIRHAARSVRELSLGCHGRVALGRLTGTAVAETLPGPASKLAADAAVIESAADLAESLGLGRNAEEAEIARAFMDASGYEVWLEIVRTEQTVAGAETWYVRVERRARECRLALRQRRRGEWIWQGVGVPEEVLTHFRARVSASGEILQRRPWDAWTAMLWAGPGDRRLRLRGGRLVARVVVPEVRRPTGAETGALRIGAIGEHSLDEVDPVIVPLPCSLTDLENALGDVMRRSLALWERDCGIASGRIGRDADPCPPWSDLLLA